MLLVGHAEVLKGEVIVKTLKQLVFDLLLLVA